MKQTNYRDLRLRKPLSETFSALGAAQHLTHIKSQSFNHSEKPRTRARRGQTKTPASQDNLKKLHQRNESPTKVLPQRQRVPPTRPSQQKNAYLKYLPAVQPAAPSQGLLSGKSALCRTAPRPQPQRENSRPVFKLDLDRLNLQAPIKPRGKQAESEGGNFKRADPTFGNLAHAKPTGAAMAEGVVSDKTLAGGYRN